MVTPEQQWRIDSLAKPEHFEVGIEIGELLSINLSDEELDRLYRKIPLVVNSAMRLCAAMLKGTIKYEKDDWTLQEWFEHLRDEAVDQVNYISLMEESVRQAIPEYKEGQ